MADDIFIFIPKGAPFIDTGVSPSVSRQDGQIHAFDSSDSDELAAATRIQTAGAGFDVSTLVAAAVGLSLGGQTKFAAGSAAAPSITTTGDLDTGMFFPAANTLGWALGGVGSLFLTPDGLGIGVAFPERKLQVNGAARIGNADNVAAIEIYGAVSRGLLWAESAGVGLFDASFNSRIYAVSSGIKLWAGGSERAGLNTSGNFGLGTTLPGYRLHVVGDNVGIMSEGATSYGAFYAKGAGTSDSFLFMGNVTSGERARITATNAAELYLQTSANGPIILSPGGVAGVRVGTAGLAVGASSFGAGAANVIAIADGTAPTSSPAGVGQIYVESGALKYRGSAGTVTQLAAA